ncbi:MAG: MogA/MoaB family molybdenum cofactor biosynthesis protein [Nitrospirales bacterium]
MILEPQLLRAAILVINSKIVKGIQEDAGREDLERIFRDANIEICHYEVVKDEQTTIQDHLIELCDVQNVNVVLTVGGTGVRPTDWAPEATKQVIDKEIPGIGEAMRTESLKKVKTAMLSRGTAGIRGTTLIVNLPGSPRGARENLSVFFPILDHTLSKISGGIYTSG